MPRGDCHDPGVVDGSFFRLTAGAARTVSCAHNLQGLFGSSFFCEDDEEDFDGPTVAVVVAERFDTVTADLPVDMLLTPTSTK